MKIFHLLFVCIICSSWIITTPTHTNLNKLQDSNYVSIGNGTLEFIPPSTFEDVEVNIQTQTSATTFIGSETYDTQITIMSKVLPKEIAMSYNNLDTQAPDGVVQSTAYATKFGESYLHYSKVQILPSAPTHEFNTIINTPTSLLMILCYTHSGDQEKIEELEEVLVASFQTIRVANTNCTLKSR